NVGSTFLSITSIIVTGSSEFSQTNTCGSGVGGGQSCTITVTFRPTVAGFVTGDVSISDNGGPSPQTGPLSGLGVTLCSGPVGFFCRPPCVCFFGVCRSFYSILDPKWNELFGSLVGPHQPAFASCGN